MTDGPLNAHWEVRRSSRRKKSIAVHREGAMYVVSAPAWMSAADVQRHAAELVARLQSREPAVRSDEDLLTQAHWLRMEFIPEAPEPHSVRWATQESRWGSCTSVDRSIRVSRALQRAPQYVIDAVIVHELAHLMRSDHGPEFRRLIARYPENGRADAFLAGMSHAKGVDIDY